MDPAELKELDTKLSEHGFDPDCGEEDKLLQLWSLYVQAEVELKAASQDMEQLRLQQAEEMKEVENYVEHIRSLSDEREALTLEFEQENEQLKAELEQLKSSHSEETKEMLLQQGLDDIAQGTVSEQIAYLLVERARLLDELETEQNKLTKSINENSLDASQLQQKLQQERDTLEEELRQQRESSKVVKAQLQEDFDRQMTILKAEKNRADAEVIKAKQKIKDLEKDILKTKGQLGKEKLLREKAVKEAIQKSNSESSPQRNRYSPSVDIMKLQEDKRKVDRELLSLKGKTRILEDQKKDLQAKVKKLEDDFKQPPSTRPTSAMSQDSNLTALQSQVDMQRTQISELQASCDKLSSEKQEAVLKLSLAEKDVKDLIEKEKEWKKSDVSYRENEQRHKREISDLTLEKQKLTDELKELRDSMSKTQQGQGHLENKLTTTENDLKTQKEQLERIQNTHKSKVRTLELKIESLQDELSDHKKEMQNQKKEHDKLLNLAKLETTSVQEKLAKEINKKENTETSLSAEKAALDKQNKELKIKLNKTEQDAISHSIKMEGLAKEKDNLVSEKARLLKEVETWKRQSEMVHGQKNESTDRILMLEHATQQLEGDNKELATKLSEALTQCEETTQLLQQEKKKNGELSQGTEEKLQRSLQEIQTLNNEIDHLRDELRTKQTQIRKLEAESSNEKVKVESGLSALRRDLAETRVNNKQQMEQMTEKLEQAYKECHQTKTKLREKEQELFNIQQDASKVKNSGTKLEAQLESEIQLRSDLENRNAMLEQEMSKVWSQMKDVLEKMNVLETQKHQLQEELDRKSSMSRQNESVLTQRSSDQGRQLNQAQNRAEHAERRLNELQCDLEEALSRLQAAEQQLREAATLRIELQSKKDENIRLRNQLQEEKLQRSVESQSLEEVKHKMNRLKEKESKLQAQNKELQHTLLDVEAKLNTMKEETRSVNDMHQVTEQNKKSLADQAFKLQQEIETLQLELLAVSEKYKCQIQRYEHTKNKTKSKLQRARELFNREKARLREQISRVSEEMSMIKANLIKESEWKQKLEQNNKKLTEEKRELLAQNAENEEIARDKTREMTLMSARLKFLENENFQLQDRVDGLMKQKIGLDKMCKEYEHEKQREAVKRALTPSAEIVNDKRTPSPIKRTIFTSGLGSTMSEVTWDHQNGEAGDGNRPISARSVSPYSLVNGLVNRTIASMSDRSLDSIDS